MIALILKNFKKIIYLLIALSLSAAVVLLAASGFECGKFSKTKVDIEKLK